MFMYEENQKCKIYIYSSEISRYFLIELEFVYFAKTRTSHNYANTNRERMQNFEFIT